MRAVRTLSLRFALLAACGAAAMAAHDAAAQSSSVPVTGGTLVNHGLVGVGRIPAAQRDKLDETFGSMSALTLDVASWKRQGDSYTGTMLTLPDRGYNVEGTTDYSDRFNTVTVRLTPYTGSGAAPAQDQVKAVIEKTTLLTEADGKPFTGLDAQPGTGVRAAANGLPPMPQGYNGKLSLDPEGIALLPDGTLFISDEYGPYVYRFSADGKLMSAIQPPEALLPMRGGKLDFSSNNPAAGQPEPKPKNPDVGRQNNQGLEGLSLTPDRRTLVALLQSATRQDGGNGGGAPARHNTRLLTYDVIDPAAPKLTGHYVVPLPRFTDKDKTLVAAQSEILALSGTQFLVLSRDSGAGAGLKKDTSLYRGIDLVDIAGATNLMGTPYEGATPVAPEGKLVDGVKAATLTRFIDLNDAAQLARFGLHNGAPNDADNLSEKWEALGLVPALDPQAPDDWFLFVGNDNDFMTTKGFQVGEAYDAGADVDTMLMVYRLTVPGYAAK